MRTITRLLCGAVIACVLAAGEALARPRTFVAGDRVRLKVDVPPGYSFETKSDAGGQVRVKLENPVWRIVVAAAIAPSSEIAVQTEEEQRNLLVTQAADILALSKEQDYRFTPLHPVKGSGVYCIFSDPSVTRAEDLGPDEYLHIVAGVKTVRGAVIYFQILCNDLKSPEFQEAMGLFVDGFDKA